MKHKEQGAALVIGLLLLAVATIVGVAGLSGSNLQERIATNQKQQTEAMMAAESGFSAFADWLSSDVENHWGTDSWKLGSGGVIPSTSPDSNYDGSSYFLINDSDVTWEQDCYDDPSVDPDVDPNEVCVLINGHAVSGSNLLSNVKLEFEIKKVDVPLHPAFSYGIIANQAIEISGNATITGNVHSNLTSGDGVTITGGSTIVNGNVTAVDTININGTINGTSEESSDPVDMPVVTTTYLDSMRTLSMSSPNSYNGYGGNDCSNLLLNGDLNGIIIFCEGNTIIDQHSEFSNVTIISGGDIRINGAMDLDAGGDLSVGIIANGEIDFNGSRDSVAAFWSNGDYIQSGSASGNGSIVSGGSVTQSGKFTFVQAPVSVLPGLPPGAPIAVYSKWQEIRG